MRLLMFATLLCTAPALHAGNAPAPAPAPIEVAVTAYEQGDFKRALKDFTRLSRAGVPAADYNLAVMNLRGEVPKADPREALRLMTRAAEAGFVTALFGLGQLHELGQAGLRVNLPQAHVWYLRAAEAGSVDGQVAVATAFYLGRGADKDAAKAVRWFRVAAQGGDIGAMYMVASMFETGDGVERDLREARYWYSVAARNGDDAAPSKVKELDAKLGAPST